MGCSHKRELVSAVGGKKSGSTEVLEVTPHQPRMFELQVQLPVNSGRDMTE